MEALKSNNWGIYLKNEPVTKVPMNDGAHMFKVTEVDPVHLLEAIDESEEVE